MKRPYAALAALLGLFALGLQFYLMLGYAAANGQTPSWAVLNFFSFFTVLTNTITAMSLAATAWGISGFFARPKAQTSIAVYILIVAVIYTLLLRNLWDPRGAQRLADYLLHYAMPAIYIFYWALFVPKDGLRFADAIPWLIYPAAYVAFVLLRGAFSGHYPYPFLDAARLGYARVAVNVAGLGAAFYALGLIAVWIGRRFAKRPAELP